jgi:hypothetical protein
MENKLKWRKVILLIFFTLMICAWIFWAWCWWFFTVLFIFQWELWYGIEIFWMISLALGILSLLLWYFFFKKIIESYKQKKISIKESLLLCLSSVLFIWGFTTSIIFLINIIFDFDGIFVFSFIIFSFISYIWFIWFKKLMNFNNKNNVILKTKKGDNKIDL